jgi:FMN phosphatase YigB (HAD superfamily)
MFFTHINEAKPSLKVLPSKAPTITLDVMDLDSTLTSSTAEEALERTIVIEMASYYPDKSAEEVDAINKAAYQEHGCSFMFMERTFGIKKDVFVKSVYERFHKNHGHLYQPNKRLKRALIRHNRPRMIFTASPMFHAQFVLKRMGILDDFDDIQAADGALIAGRSKYAISVLRDLRLHIWDIFKTLPQNVAIFDDKSAVLDAAEKVGYGHRVQVRDKTATFHRPITANATMQVKSVSTALNQLAS